jgi:uncharacterized protein YbjQ (UPF0145 family)
MKRAIIASALVLLAAASQAYAADRRVEIPFAEVLNSPEAKDAGIDGSVRFYLSGQNTPHVVGRMGEGVSIKRTNGFGKSDQTSCDRAMLAVLKSFQESAKQKGANAVIDFVSYYKKNEERSASSYSCYVGTLMSAVTMKGTYAKIR